LNKWAKHWLKNINRHKNKLICLILNLVANATQQHKQLKTVTSYMIYLHYLGYTRSSFQFTPTPFIYLARKKHWTLYCT